MVAAAPDAHGQARYRTARADNFRQQPGVNQKVLGLVHAGAEVDGGDSQNGWVEVTLEGWIWGRSIAKTTRDGFDLAVASRSGENLRAEPNGRVLARLASGFLLNEVHRREDGWVQVRRVGWMWAGSLERVDADAAAQQARDSPAAPAALLDRAVTAHQAEVRRAPDGDTAGSLAENTAVRVLARSGNWVRIATEGWIKEADLKPSAPGVLAGVSAAEVRSRPSDFEGKLVQWTVQFIALQTADELRREVPRGERYMLARGPLPEAGFVYVRLQPAQLGRVEQLQPLAELVIVARVKVARSQYLGNPVVELVDLAVRKP
jgi:uncharacterized protein YgiM (DUF1202 family)